MNKIFSLIEPEKPLPLIFDSPHSGHAYPEDFKYICDLKDLRKSEDAFVDDLFSAAPDHGGTLLSALFPRSYIDVNRAIDDIDPQVIDGQWPEPINPTARSNAGIGLIWRLARPGIPIYDAPLSVGEAQARIAKSYTKYHLALEKTIQDAYYNFGQVWHINCHSMPASSAYPKRPMSAASRAPVATDFCLGNRDGTSCSLDFTRQVRAFLQGLGYSVTLNDPFKGVELIQRHSDPLRGKHALQIEINRALYMNEETGEKNNNYKVLKANIEKLIQFCAAYVTANLQSQAAD